MVWNIAVALIANARSQSASVHSSTVPAWTMPAQLKRTSTGPTSAASAAMAEASVTSSRRGRAAGERGQQIRVEVRGDDVGALARRTPRRSRGRCPAPPPSPAPASLPAVPPRAAPCAGRGLMPRATYRILVARGAGRKSRSDTDADVERPRVAAAGLPKGGRAAGCRRPDRCRRWSSGCFVARARCRAPARRRCRSARRRRTSAR